MGRGRGVCGKANGGIAWLGDVCGVDWGVWVEGSAIVGAGGEERFVGDGTLWNVPVVGEKLRRSGSVFSRCREGCRTGVDGSWSCAAAKTGWEI